MERHLLGMPLKMGLISSDLLDSDDSKDISAKDKRILKMLKEDLVDPNKLVGGASGGGKKRNLSGLRIASNTVDVRGITLSEAQRVVETFLEGFVEQIDTSGVIYVNHGNSKSADVVKTKLRSWLQTYPLVKRAKAADLSDGGDAFTVVELDY
jgi:DNA-nicking Smr family endonuclease